MRLSPNPQMEAQRWCGMGQGHSSKEPQAWLGADWGPPGPLEIQGLGKEVIPCRGGKLLPKPQSQAVAPGRKPPWAQAALGRAPVWL